MAGRKLAVNTTALDEDGRMVTFEAGTVVSAKVAEGITNPKAWATADEADGEQGDRGDDGGLFDPNDASVDEVNNHLADSDEDEVTRVLDAESAGKGRKGILEGPYAPEA